MTATLRAGDLDRQRTVHIIGRAVTHGYLELDEYDSRLRSAYAAQTTADLQELVTDLPVSRLAGIERREARRAAARLSVRLHLAAYLLMVAAVLTVWLAVALSAGAWYFWPVWPIMGAGIGVVTHAVSVRYGTASSGSRGAGLMP
jgi:uncharacterized protein DUF1707/2TM domain-containing protein